VANYYGAGARHGGTLRAVVELSPEATTSTVGTATKKNWGMARRALLELEGAELIERYTPKFGDQRANRWRVTRTGAQILEIQLTTMEQNRDAWVNMVERQSLLLSKAHAQLHGTELVG
jgi:hypothetical protein